MKITGIAVIAILLCILVLAAPTLAQLQPVDNMWDEIHHTILDMQPETPETAASPQDWAGVVRGTVADPEVKWFSDFVYAYIGEEEIDAAGHAIVHWWLIEDDAAGMNSAAIYSIMEWLGGCPEESTEPCGCGGYPQAPSLTPKERVDAVWSANKPTYTTFTNIVDGFYYIEKSPDNTYIKTVTQDNLPGETRGLTMVETANTGAERILVVTLAEYLVDHQGGKSVCIEMGTSAY